MIATASQSRSTSSSWWLEKTTGHAGGGVFGQHAAEHVDADRVEAGERLVEHEQLRLVHQRGGELDALLVAERELLDAVLGALGQAEALDPAVRGVLGRCDAVQRGEVDRAAARTRIFGYSPRSSGM